MSSPTKNEDEQNSDKNIQEKPSRFDEGKINLKKFFEHLPKLESHYCQKSSTKLYVRPTFKTKLELYLLYKDNWCVEHNIAPLQKKTNAMSA